MAGRSFASIVTVDQWARASHDGTTLVDGCVRLAWDDLEPDANGPVPEVPPSRLGLTFDPGCRLVRADPETGALVRHAWDEERPGGPGPDPLGEALLAPTAVPVGGDFVRPDHEPVPRDAPGFGRPSAVAVTSDGSVVVADAVTGSLVVLDPVDDRIIRRTQVVDEDGDTQPIVDLVASGADVLVLTGPQPRLHTLRPGLEPAAWPEPPRPPGAGAPDAGTSAVAVDLVHGQPVVLVRRSDGSGQLLLGDGRRVDVPSVRAVTDLAVDAQHAIVVAGGPGEPFVRLAEQDGRWSLDARLDSIGYDGRGIVTTPDGRVGYWTAAGLRRAFVLSGHVRADGRLTTYRLDAGRHGTRWGRLFLDACIPPGTDVRVRTHVADDDVEPDEVVERIAWLAPPEVPVDDLDLDLTPPMLAQDAADALAVSPAGPLHRRETGRELPWSRPEAGDPFQVYEDVVAGSAGRYLWVQLELRGTGRATPRVRALRVERPAHDLARRLPRAWSRDAEAADFLQRLLSPVEGELADLLARADDRHLLVDPRTVPEEALAWLASFVGLTLDDRIRPDRRRTLVAAANRLFAFRGTVAGVAELLEIAVGVEPVIVEHFRLRGVGTLVGEVDPATDPAASSVLGAGLRLGVPGEPAATAADADGPVDGPAAEDPFAHRFSVLIPASLGDEELALVHDLLDAHRPAHTVVDVCTVDGGSRVGVGLHVELTSIIGPGAGFTAMRVGAGVIGREQVLGDGGPTPTGVRPGAGIVGASTRVGWGR
jgi:phage tail-like protein